MEIKWINEINACTTRCIFGIQMKLFLLQAMSFQNPIARWRFQRCDESFTWGGHGFWGWCHDSKSIIFSGDPGWLDTSLANVNVEARKTNLAGTWLKPCRNSLSKISCPGVPVCYFSLRKTIALREMDKAWRFDEVRMLPFSVCAIMGFQGAVGVMINKDIWNCANATQTAGSQGSC